MCTTRTRETNPFFGLADNSTAFKFSFACTSSYLCLPLREIKEFAREIMRHWHIARENYHINLVADVEVPNKKLRRRLLKGRFLESCCWACSGRDPEEEESGTTDRFAGVESG